MTREEWGCTILAPVIMAIVMLIFGFIMAHYHSDVVGRPINDADVRFVLKAALVVGAFGAIVCWVAAPLGAWWTDRKHDESDDESGE